MDEIWTGDKYHAEVFRTSGVKVPIYVYPQAIDTSMGIPQPFVIENRPRFLFYSIFQWIERKNPELLIRAYYEEFNGHKDVGLLLKTYGLDFSDEQRRKVSRDIIKWKQIYGGSNPPPVLLYDQLLARDDVFRFHSTGDCFVLPHRGEGWGIPQVEAILMEKPIISTSLGGMHDWINRKNYQALDRYKFDYVKNMDFVPWYSKNQKWADPDLEQLREKMRWVYENYDRAKNQTLKAKQEVIKKFSYEAVGRVMRERIEEIYAEELIPYPPRKPGA
jgi:glycosyltransferase involved in cell wall biosynthesis